MTAPTLKIPDELKFLAPVVYDDLVRIGCENDGGYVVPRLLTKEVECLLAFGLNDDWSFESHLLQLNPNLTIHAYDHTVSAYHFKRAVAVSLVRAALGKAKVATVWKSIRTLRSYQTFFRGNTAHFRERVHNRQDWPIDATIDAIFSRIRSDKVMVKMDIEGSEYRVIEDLMRHSSKILGMAIEFHDTEPLRPVFIAAVRGIMTAYEIVHVHANNYQPVSRDSVPEALELTFLRKEFCAQMGKRLKLPVDALDAPNNPNRADYVLDFS